MTIQGIQLAEGETYIGGIVDAAGITTHIILLPGDNDRANWQAQMDWAKSIGGDLPTKAEAALLFSTHKDQFKPNWYWTNETFVDPDDLEDTAYAWLQSFVSGYQYRYHKGYNYCRARAVRRLIIQ